MPPRLVSKILKKGNMNKISKSGKYSEDKIIEALKMYQDGMPVKDIQKMVGLPEGQRGMNIFNGWRTRSGIQTRRTANIDWKTIEKAVKT